MKTGFLVLILIGTYLSTFSQETTLPAKKYNKLLNENERLQQVEKDCEEHEEVFKNRIDSLSIINQKIYSELERTEAEKEKFQSSLEHMTQHNDSMFIANEDCKSMIDRLEIRIQEKTRELGSLSQEKERSEREQYEKGQKSILNTIKRSYDKLSFDDMIRASSEDQIHRDLTLINKGELNQKLKNLDIYFAGEEVLTQKFNPRNVQHQLEMARLIKDSSVLVEELIDKLVNYKLRNDGLKEAIQKIQVVDENFIANNEKDKKNKEALILAEISWYLYNYESDFEDYPYLSSIVIEIMKEKHKNPNTNVSKYLQRL
jgi:hypothetical protein